MRVWLVLILILGSGGIARAGATTQPSVQAVTQVLPALAKALIAGDASTITQVIAKAPVRAFGSKEDSDARQLAGMLTGTKLIATRTYSGIPATLAGDLADDVSASADIPHTVRERMKPVNMNRANSIASRWIARVLKPQAGQVIGVLVFYEPPMLDSAESGRVLFGLFKFEPGENDLGIVEVMYGDPTAGL